MSNKRLNLSVMVAIVVFPLTLHADVYKLDAVETTATQVNMVNNDGISDGFLDKNVTVGPLGKKKAIDTPYQINTIPKELSENGQAMGLEDVVKYIPSAQIEYRGGADLGRPQTRGMRGEVVANSFWDGLHIVSTTATAMEMFDDLQIINGLAGALYGPTAPSGIYSFTRKRPTADYENSVKMTYGYKGYGEAMADVGGMANDAIGYRAVVIGGDGEGYVDNSALRRKLVSLGLDFHLTERLTLETNFSYYNYIKEGYSSSYLMPYTALGVAKYTLPDAFDATDKKYGPNNGGREITTTTYSTKLKYEIADNWHAEAGYLNQRADRNMYIGSSTFNSNAGTYTPAVVSVSPMAARFDLDSWMGYVTTEQNFLGLEHDLALGGNGYRWDIYGADGSRRYVSSTTDVESLTLADTIKLNDQWQTVLSTSKSWIDKDAYATTGATTSEISKDGYSYAASLIYKPLKNLSFYVTYADSLQQFDPVTYSGKTFILDPYRSKQYEIGSKLSLDRVDLSAALFQIKRPTAYLGYDGIYEIQGDQTNQGVEFMASGKVAESVALFGGITYMDTDITGAKIANIDNKQAIGMPEWQANLLAEYTVPSYKELVLSSNFHYTGKRAIDPANTEWADSYFTTDIGARYATKQLFGDKTILRLSVNNITNEKYWAGIFAGNVSGLDGDATAGTTTLFLGDGRNVTASIEVKF
ncbi:TonB dependent/ligand-gated channel protein [Sulfurospirillum diekertiae]|uniref:TonB dependent/ligand-gated channel protein n=1 Tax=Sulfurospirillum diekertiae TaxID=1854492 RepID=A0A290HGB6_9BACT|nr:TonB-dependent receptor [Sulfurospirillum diekertiae]ATB70592.1 TonB dependent/ligand-gated channel protein [Sulfurospirillum diekertiae]